MHKAFPVLAAALVAAATTQQALAQSKLSLKASAANDGYTLQWLLPERSVVLFRPGTVIVLRPGASMYEVNDRVEYADAPPVYRDGDLRISHALASRLANLATRQPSRDAASRAATAPQAPEQSATGSITLDVRPQAGSEAVDVRGHAPSGAPVTITLLATISSDVPTIVVSRHNVQPDVNGAFHASIPIAPEFARDTILRVLATSAAGVTPAAAALIVASPNGAVTVPLEQNPHDPR